MFDINFSELVVIGGVALVVLGPEKLAVVARATGKLAGKAQRYVNDVKLDLSREGELAELRKLKTELESAGHEIKQSISHGANVVQQEFSVLETSVKADLATAIPLSDRDTPTIPDYQAGLNTIQPSFIASSDRLSLRLELEQLHDEFIRLEYRMEQLKNSLETNLTNAINNNNAIPIEEKIEQKSEQST